MITIKDYLFRFHNGAYIYKNIWYDHDRKQTDNRSMITPELNIVKQMLEDELVIKNNETIRVTQKGLCLLTRPVQQKAKIIEMEFKKEY